MNGENLRFSADDRKLMRRWLLVDLPERIRIAEGRKLEIGRYSTVHHDLDLVESDVRIGHCTYSWSNMAHVSCGNYCSIALGCTFGPGRHPLDRLTTHPFTYIPDAWPDDGLPVRRVPFDGVWRPVEIGHDCWIGQGAVIMGGVRIGTGAVVAANAVVTHDVPPFAIVAGMPAKVLRYRFDPQVVEEILASGWWNYDLQNWNAAVDWSDVRRTLASVRQAIGDGTLGRLPDRFVTVRDLRVFDRHRKFVFSNEGNGSFMRLFGWWLRCRAGDWRGRGT